ncbi:hypothetical protein ED312_15450 [Sinomicrobium pectinilyticum]|uniref:DUF6265 domain-containing protein n=1 Tax=Sinomicrobium pectinilyticum TaxID=1084421 RepID=A0A3N0E5I1_SINP1|nr:DUF6265 family protein [Sinomicrobium pectinilyticum]RNL83063.1 hypothetical protein ED312_15450 [Sinomicrobium pectinilyticum]
MKTFILLCFIPISITYAQHTVQWQADSVSPSAQLSELSWIAGYWEGTALGGTTEEIWSSPLGGSMMGSFKLVVNDLVKFYELCTISQQEGTLLLRIKHFDRDLKGWEEKDESEEFRLVRMEKDKAYFDGLTFEKIGEDEINIHVFFEESAEEMTFHYKRAK